MGVILMAKFILNWLMLLCAQFHDVKQQLFIWLLLLNW